MIPTFYNSAHVRVRRGLVEHGGGRNFVDLSVRWAIFEHPRHGLVAIDTGYTAAVTQGAQRSLALKLYAAVLRPALLQAGQIGTVLAQLGRPLDLLILSHFHADHIAGARSLGVRHVLAPALQDKAARLHHGVFAELLPPAWSTFEQCPAVSWRGLRAFDILGDGSVLAVPLDGHMRGHFGFWFAAANLLYAVDTEWTLPALSPERAPRGLAYRLVTQDRAAAIRARAFVKAFQDDGGHIVLCHDPDPTPWDAV